MGFIKEFKDFAMRGNLIDFAVGVVVGGAFGKVTSSFVDGMVMPVVGKIIGGANFSDLKYKIQDGTKESIDATGKMVLSTTSTIFINISSMTSWKPFLYVAAYQKETSILNIGDLFSPAVKRILNYCFRSTFNS